MEQRNVEVTVVSAEGLKKPPRVGRARSYAVVWVSHYDRRSTHVDKVGGRRPVWNQKFDLPIPQPAFDDPASCLTVQIYTRRYFREKCVGVVVIPLSDMLQLSSEEISQEHATKSYNMQKRSGHLSKATLQLSIHVGAKFVVNPPPMNGQPIVAYPSTAYPPPPQGYAPQPYYQQGYPPQPNYYPPMQPAPPPKRSGFGGGGMGFGTGLLAGALGGLIVGEVIDDGFDGGFDF